ncbi:SRPBCC domain-containing protein [Paenibacillus senegalensis]|uniref:SRPBCC domain-containing protein n=1 Tax=Paenibacillus senegalensis TaxID=1465766 RepID=UPI00028980B7|nr:SRPBCC domain-containing protein [Paenibacillus senegalensis]
MAKKMVTRTEGRELIMERVFDAPRDLVFQAFTKEEHLKQWWGPKGWSLTYCDLDFRPDGVWHYCMKCVDESQGDFFGMESWGKAVYAEIVEGEKIVYTDYFSDAEGSINTDMPAATVTMIFLEQGGKTKLINRSEYPTIEALQQVIDMGVEEGTSLTFDCLDEYLEATR